MSELKSCPFCGSTAEVIVEEEKFLIVGCSNRQSMLCPQPTIVVYKKADGVDYRWWNTRATTEREMVLAKAYMKATCSESRRWTGACQCPACQLAREILEEK
jgi:hypothetical protein